MVAAVGTAGLCGFGFVGRGERECGKPEQKDFKVQKKKRRDQGDGSQKTRAVKSRPWHRLSTGKT